MQQEVTLHGMVQVYLLPADDAEEGRALPALDQPFLKCPADTKIEELQQVPTECNDLFCHLVSGAGLHVPHANPESHKVCTILMVASCLA